MTLTGQPVSVTDQDGCTFPPGGPTCTSVAPGPSSAILQGEISDYNYTNYSDPSYPPGFVDSFDGMEMYTNIAETSLPPNLMVVDGQNELELDLTDHHFLHDGTTVVHGDFYLRIPAAFLSTYWGINDPSTLSTDGLNASIGAGGGTLAVTVEPGNAAVDVQISGMTFSRRHLKIKLGVVTPRGPKNVKARRVSGTTAKVTFTKSRPRGQKVTRLQAQLQGRQFDDGDGEEQALAARREVSRPGPGVPLFGARPLEGGVRPAVQQVLHPQVAGFLERVRGPVRDSLSRKFV